MKTILIISDYAACYRGNFIPSIEAIDSFLVLHNGLGEPARVIYLFPDVADQQPWAEEFAKQHSAFFISRSFYSKHFTLSDLRMLRRILATEHVDLIHTHFIFYNYALCVAHYTFARHIPVIGHFHNQFRIPPTRSAFLKRFVVEHTYAQILGVSPSVAEGVKKYTHCRNVDYVMNAIAFERLDRFETINLRDVPAQKIVLMAGWPASVKGVDVAVKALNRLRQEKNLDIKLCIMQSGDFPQTERCVRLAIGIMPDWVVQLLPREDIAAYYHAADIFLSASRTEACPYSLVEAAYCTLMIISSDIPGPRELQIEGMRMFPMDDVDALTHTLYDMLTLSPVEQQSIRQERLRVMQRYNLNTWCEKIVNHYKTFIS